MRYLAFFVFVFLIFPSFGQDRYCSDNWACVEVIDETSSPEFVLKNKKAFPVTITLIVNTRNLEAKGNFNNKYTVTRVVEGNKSVSVLALAPRDSSRSFKYNYDFRWSPGDMNAVHDDSVRYRLPFDNNKKYGLVQGFNGGFSHHGASKYAVDFAMPVGSPVHAARDGVVIDITEHNTKGGASRRYAKYANFIAILHDDRTTGEYYHLKHNGALVEVGQKVKAGDLIGYSGNTGFSSLPHLHFAVYKAKSHGNYESLPFTFVDNAKTTRQYHRAR